MMHLSYTFVTLQILFCIFSAGADYVVDSSNGLERKFDGIGGLSGGGATSKLLVNYPDARRNEILDYLFKPNFGASLQILKVEIGGDSQTTDGTESSHMHEEWDENYQRGYEWWLMLEAKKRNPDIKLYGLPWAFPGWLGEGTRSPYTNIQKTVTYIVKWIMGAKKVYSLDIDFIGIWNERPYNSSYIKLLRKTLDAQNLTSVRIVASDSDWDISKEMLTDKELYTAVDYIGTHYPGTLSSDEAKKSAKSLWSSEDYSTFNDDVGAGCWARILNQNYVNGYMTSTISWNLIASYYNALPFGRDGLMTANEPWSGHYVVESPIWVTAHTTHFTDIGWGYLKHGQGVGGLDKGGSYVSLSSPNGDQFTMVIETMSHNHSVCIRPRLPEYTVSPQKATFVLKGALAKVQTLNVWMSKLHFDGTPSTMFKQMPSIPVTSGTVSLDLDVDVIYTLTTVKRMPQKLYDPPPPSQTFPLPYKDRFEGYPTSSEAYNFAPQIGVFEVHDSGDSSHGNIMRQVVLHQPVDWCNQNNSKPINLGGDYNWTNIFISTDFYIPSVNGTGGVFVATRVTDGGCNVYQAKGIFFFVFPDSQHWQLSLDLQRKHVIDEGDIDVKVNTWYNLALMTNDISVVAYLNNNKVTKAMVSSPGHGFVALGTDTFGLADFDNLLVEEPKSPSVGVL